jgi:hypothetical protein
MAAPLPTSKDLHAQITNILAVPTLSSYGRALSWVEEIAELASSASPSSSAPSQDPAIVAILLNCDVYEKICCKAIHRLTTQAAQLEHETYDRAVSHRENGDADADADGNKQGCKGVVFRVDKEEHVPATLEALQLEQFLEEQEQRQREQELKSANGGK